MSDSRIARTFCATFLVLTAVALSGVSSAAAQGTPADYCEGDGGPAGAATEAEHSVLVGDPPPPPGVRTSRLVVDGVATRVLEAGPATASDAVVFVHGNPGSSRDWDELVAALGRFTRAVAFDISGFGQSDKLAREVQTLDGSARYIQGLLDELGIRRAVLVAHDLGGPWGLQWAAQHPDSLTGVVLINTGVLIDYVPHALASTTRDLFRAVANNPRPLPSEFVDRMYDDFDRATRCAILRHYRSLAEDFANLGRKQAEVLRRRRRPALVIWGERDPYVPAEQAQKQREAFPEARIELFEDSGHWSFIDNAVRTRGLVVPFLSPNLTAARPSVVAGSRRVSLKVKVEGPLPAHEVRARLYRAAPNGRSAGLLAGSAGGVTVAGERTLAIDAKQPLRPRRYLIKLRALGLPTRRILFRVPKAR